MNWATILEKTINEQTARSRDLLNDFRKKSKQETDQLRSQKKEQISQLLVA